MGEGRPSTPAQQLDALCPAPSAMWSTLPARCARGAWGTWAGYLKKSLHRSQHVGFTWKHFTNTTACTWTQPSLWCGPSTCASGSPWHHRSPFLCGGGSMASGSVEPGLSNLPVSPRAGHPRLDPAMRCRGGAHAGGHGPACGNDPVIRFNPVGDTFEPTGNGRYGCLDGCSCAFALLSRVEPSWLHGNMDPGGPSPGFRDSPNGCPVGRGRVILQSKQRPCLPQLWHRATAFLPRPLSFSATIR